MCERGPLGRFLNFFSLVGIPFLEGWSIRHFTYGKNMMTFLDELLDSQIAFQSRDTDLAQRSHLSEEIYQEVIDRTKTLLACVRPDDVNAALILASSFR